MKKVRSLVLAHAKNQWCQKCNSSTLTDGCVETVHLGHALHQWDASEEGGGDVGGRYTSLYFMKESQKQEFVSLEPSTECFRENPRRLDMMIMSGKVKCAM